MMNVSVETAETSGQVAKLKKKQATVKTRLPLDARAFEESILDEKGITRQERFVIYAEKPNAVEVHKLHRLRSDRYMLRRTLFLQIVKGEDNYIAKMPSLEIFGTGGDKEEAVLDFEQTLIECFEMLQGEKANLAPHLSSQLRRLENVIKVLSCP